MRIACPGCAAEYEVPDAALAAGPRMLRCARCATQFRAALPEAGAAAPPVSPRAAEQPAAVDRERPAEAGLRAGDGPARPPPTRGPSRHSPIDPAPEEAERRSGGAGLVLAWVLSLALLGGAGWAAFAYRAEVMEAWPPSIRLYEALGMADRAP